MLYCSVAPTKLVTQREAVISLDLYLTVADINHIIIALLSCDPCLSPDPSAGRKKTRQMSNFMARWHHVSILITLPCKEQPHIYSFIHLRSLSLFSSSLTVSFGVGPFVIFVLFLSLIVFLTHFLPASELFVSANDYKAELIVRLSAFCSVYSLRQLRSHFPVKV